MHLKFPYFTYLHLSRTITLLLLVKVFRAKSVFIKESCKKRKKKKKDSKIRGILSDRAQSGKIRNGKK